MPNCPPKCHVIYTRDGTTYITHHGPQTPHPRPLTPNLWIRGVYVT